MIRDFQSIFGAFWTATDKYLADLSGNATNCTRSKLPSAKEYYEELTPLMVCAIVVSTLATAATGVVYVISLRHVLSRTAVRLRSPTVYVLTIHPVASLLAFMCVVVPRVYFMMEVVVQDMFGICVYKMFCLLVAYCEDSKLLGVPTRSCCCCCLSYPESKCWNLSLNRRTLMKLRVLVLQMPVVLWVMYGVCFALWSEDSSLLDAVYPYLWPVQVSSVLLAAWGTLTLARTLSPALGGVRATHKLLALQLTVLVPELQLMMGHYVASFFVCSAPLTPVFWCNYVVNVVTLLEVLCLSLWSYHLYCRDDAGFQQLHDEADDPPEPAGLVEDNTAGYTVV